MPGTVLRAACELPSLTLMSSPGCHVPKARARCLRDMCSRRKVQELAAPASRDSTCGAGRQGGSLEEGPACPAVGAISACPSGQDSAFVEGPARLYLSLAGPHRFPPHPPLSSPLWPRAAGTNDGVAQCPGPQGPQLTGDSALWPTLWHLRYDLGGKNCSLSEKETESCGDPEAPHTLPCPSWGTTVEPLEGHCSGAAGRSQPR